MLAEGARTCMIEVAPSQAGPGARLIFRMQMSASAKHVGILTEEERLIYAYERLDVIEGRLTMSWSRHIAFAFLCPRMKDEP